MVLELYLNPSIDKQYNISSFFLKKVGVDMLHTDRNIDTSWL